MSEPKLYIPPHTHVFMEGKRVTLIFPLDIEAEQFCKWIQWLDLQPSGKELTVIRDKEPVKQ